MAMIVKDGEFQDGYLVHGFVFGPQADQKEFDLFFLEQMVPIMATEEDVA